MQVADTALAAGRRRHPLRWGMGILGAAVVSLAVILASQPSPGAVQAATPLLGRPAPPLGGRVLSGAPLKTGVVGREWVIVSFVASWCVDCRIEAGALRRMYTSPPPSRGVAMVLVAFDDAPSATRGFLNLNGLTMPTLADPTGRTALDWGVSEPPETFVVAPDGRVVARFIGPVNFSELASVVTSKVAHS